MLLGLCSQRGCSSGLELPRSRGKCRRMTGTHGFRRRRQRGLFLVFRLVIVGAPIIAVIVLGFEVCPFPRLLAVHIDFVLAAARCCGVRGSAGTTSWLAARAEQQRTSCRLGGTDMPLLVGKTFPYEPSMAAMCDERGRSYIRVWGGLGSVVDGCRKRHWLTSQERRRRGSRNADWLGTRGWAAKGGGCVGWRVVHAGEDTVTFASRPASKLLVAATHGAVG